MINYSPTEIGVPRLSGGVSTDNADQSASSANHHRRARCGACRRRHVAGRQPCTQQEWVHHAEPGDFLAGHHDAAPASALCCLFSFAGKWPAFEALVSSAALAIASLCVPSDRRRSHPDQPRSRVFRCLPRGRSARAQSRQTPYVGLRRASALLKDQACGRLRLTEPERGHGARPKIGCGRQAAPHRADKNPPGACEQSRPRWEPSAGDQRSRCASHPGRHPLRRQVLNSQTLRSKCQPVLRPNRAASKRLD